MKPLRKAAKPRQEYRVKKFPPTLEEAVFAAQGLSEDMAEQIEIAAGLMDVSPEEVRPLIMRAAAQKAAGTRVIVPTNSVGTTKRAVVVERARPLRQFRPATTTLRPFGRTLGV